MRKRFSYKTILVFTFALGMFAVLRTQSTEVEHVTTKNDFHEQIRYTNNVRQLTPFFNTNDPQNARLAILKLVELEKLDALPLLKEFWEGGDPFQVISYPNTYTHPIVRLTLSEELMKFTQKSEYADYIKRFADDGNWIVQSVAAEALASVDDGEAIRLLVQLTRSPHRFVAESGIASLLYIAQHGQHSRTAVEALQNLRNDPELKLNSVAQGVEEAYQMIRGTHTLNVRERHADIASSHIKHKQARATYGYDELLDQQVQQFLEKGDFSAAIGVLLEHAHQNNAWAQHFLGELYLAINPPNYASASAWFLRSAAEDYAPAKFSLANLYLTGRGVEKNEAEAVFLLKEAEQQGDQSAHLLLEKARAHAWWGMSDYKSQD